MMIIQHIVAHLTYGPFFRYWGYNLYCFLKAGIGIFLLVEWRLSRFNHLGTTGGRIITAIITVQDSYEED